MQRPEEVNLVTHKFCWSRTRMGQRINLNATAVISDAENEPQRRSHSLAKRS